jgi:glycosyltransferase involved in cell wall biosynthesis
MNFLNPDIIIPTCKTENDLYEMMGDLMFESRTNKKIFTCLQESAAKNRNYGLNQSSSEYVVMCDDDITGFYRGWAEELIMPLRITDEIIYVSARLLNQDYTIQTVMGGSKDTKSPIVDVPTAPSACVAFRKSDLRFDENYIGSGWEDTDFVRQLKVHHPHGRIVINNQVQLIHKNEMKNQLGENYQKNRDYYNKKWNCNEQ